MIIRFIGRRRDPSAFCLRYPPLAARLEFAVVLRNKKDKKGLDNSAEKCDNIID